MEALVLSYKAPLMDREQKMSVRIALLNAHLEITKKLLFVFLFVQPPVTNHNTCIQLLQTFRYDLDLS